MSNKTNNNISVINQSDINDAKMANLPTRPNSKGLYGEKAMSASDLRERADALAMLAVEKVNELINAIHDNTGYKLSKDVSVPSILTYGETASTDLYTFLVTLKEELEDGTFSSRIKTGKDAQSVLAYLSDLQTQIGYSAFALGPYEDITALGRHRPERGKQTFYKLAFSDAYRNTEAFQNFIKNRGKYLAYVNTNNLPYGYDFALFAVHTNGGLGWLVPSNISNMSENGEVVFSLIQDEKSEWDVHWNIVSGLRVYKATSDGQYEDITALGRHRPERGKQTFYKLSFSDAYRNTEAFQKLWENSGKYLLYVNANNIPFGFDFSLFAVHVNGDLGWLLPNTSVNENGETEFNLIQDEKSEWDVHWNIVSGLRVYKAEPLDDAPLREQIATNRDNISRIQTALDNHKNEMNGILVSITEEINRAFDTIIEYTNSLENEVTT